MAKAAQLSFFLILRLFPFLLFFISTLGFFAETGIELRANLLHYLSKIAPVKASALIHDIVAEIAEADGTIRTIFFNEWTALARVAVVGLASYAALVILLRISGKRTLSKMNAFDFVVTVALGSTLASVLLSRDVPLVEGVTAFGLLLLVQFVITWLSVRSRTVSRLVKSTPGCCFTRESLWNMR